MPHLSVLPCGLIQGCVRTLKRGEVLGLSSGSLQSSSRLSVSLELVTSMPWCLEASAPSGENSCVQSWQQPAPASPLGPRAGTEQTRSRCPIPTRNRNPEPRCGLVAPSHLCPVGSAQADWSIYRVNRALWWYLKTYHRKWKRPLGWGSYMSLAAELDGAEPGSELILSGFGTRVHGAGLLCLQVHSLSKHLLSGHPVPGPRREPKTTLRSRRGIYSDTSPR